MNRSKFPKTSRVQIAQVAAALFAIALAAIPSHSVAAASGGLALCGIKKTSTTNDPADGGGGSTKGTVSLTADMKVQSAVASRTSSSYKLQFCVANIGGVAGIAPVVTRLQVNGVTLATFTHPSNIAPQANVCFGSTTTSVPFTNSLIDTAVLVIQTVNGETETANNTCRIEWAKETGGAGKNQKDSTVRTPPSPK